VERAVVREEGEREMRVQRYVCEAKRRAMARPMPRLPPVMRTWRMGGGGGIVRWVWSVSGLRRGEEGSLKLARLKLWRLTRDHV
jgi:hypothetical protein